MAPSISPDGRRMALTLTKDGNAEIYILDVGGRSLRRLTYNLGIDTAPSWSPNGRQIVFESDRGGVAQIFAMDAEGRTSVELAYGGEAHSPAWSPQGDRIAYVERVGGRFQIVTIPADGGRHRPDIDGRQRGPVVVAGWTPHRVLLDARRRVGHLHHGLGRREHPASDTRGRLREPQLVAQVGVPLRVGGPPLALSPPTRGAIL